MTKKDEPFLPIDIEDIMNWKVASLIGFMDKAGFKIKIVTKLDEKELILTIEKKDSKEALR